MTEDVTNEKLFYKIELLNKDIELVKVKQNEFNEYIKKTENMHDKFRELEMKLNTTQIKLESFENKIDDLINKIDKSAAFTQSTITKILDFAFKLIIITVGIYAALHGITVPKI